MKWRDAPKDRQRIYCCCHHCWESLGNNCIISAAFNLLGKQAWDDGNTRKTWSNVPQRCDLPHSAENIIPARWVPAKDEEKQRELLFYEGEGGIVVVVSLL